MAESISSSERRVASRIDRVAIGLSSLCVVHCVATVLFAATVASIGTALANPLFHEVGFAVAMLLGALALGRGYALRRDPQPLALGGAGLALMGAGLLAGHSAVEIAATIGGVVLLAVAHRRNTIAAHAGDLAGADARA